MQKIILSFCVCTIFMILACQKADNGYSITIYGRDTCGNTTALRNACSSADIKFQYLNIDERNDNLVKMYEVVRQFSLGKNGLVILSIVTVQNSSGSIGFEHPGIDEIKKLIGEYRHATSWYVNLESKIGKCSPIAQQGYV